MLLSFGGMVMRPISIQWFDRLFLSGLALELALRIIRSREALYVTNKDNIPFFIGENATYFVIMSVLWFSISIYHSKIAKWLLVMLLIAIPVIIAITVVRPAALFTFPSIRSASFSIVRPFLYIAATVMLFRSDARVWFLNRGRILQAEPVGEQER